MNSSDTTGMIAPVVRRVASSTSTMKTMPTITSQRSGDGGAVGEVVAAPQRVDDGRDRDDPGHMSHQRTRLRKRTASGKSRKLSTRVKATWM